MFESVDALRSRARRVLATAVVATAVLCGAASAQTIVLNQAGSQVTDTTIRSGAYASTNYDDGVLLTRRSTDPDWERRTILKFDTQNTIARGTPIASATLTLTVRSGLGTTLRTITAYRITQPFQEAEATWMRRQGSYNWTTAGGTVAPDQFGAALVPATAGSRVTIDLTQLVQCTVNGEFDSRYTRVLLRDLGTDAKDSYREYYPSEDITAANRPTLTIVVGTPTSTPPPAPTPDPPTSDPSGPVTLKVLQWNIAQGYATDGTSNIDRVVSFIAQQRPDVVSFNEIMVRSSTSQPATIASRLSALTGQTWSYHWVQKWGATTGEGECVMTRFPVDAVDDFLLSVSRSVAMVRVTLNGRPVSLFSTHLDHQSSATRVQQVRELVNWSSTQMEQRIIAGDFNGWPGTAEYNEMLRTHVDGWAAAVAAGTAVSFPGNPDGNTRNTRIDYVFQSRGATSTSVLGAQVFDLRDAAGVRPSDHNPLIVTFQVR